MSKEIAVKNDPRRLRLDPPRLVKMGGDQRLAVTVSHMELSNLIGELCRYMELNGDVEQREALKRTIKDTSRKWLDTIYDEAGYTHLSDTDGVYPVLDGTPPKQ